MKFNKILLQLLICIYTSACSTGRIVTEQVRAPLIQLPKGVKTVEIQNIRGTNSEAFKIALSEILMQETSLEVIHSLSRNDLIDVKLRGRQNKQNYPQADLLIRGAIQESIERRIGNAGTEQYVVTSRPFLQLIDAQTGRVITSKYLVGTSLSSTRLIHSNTIYDGYTDALTSARRMALEKFVADFTSQKSWMEIELLPFKDQNKFEELKNLISYGKLDTAKDAVNGYIEKIQSNDSEKGKAIFSLSVIEYLLGNYEIAKNILIQSHQLYPSEKIMRFLKDIEAMESENKRITLNKERAI